MSGSPGLSGSARPVTATQKSAEGIVAGSPAKARTTDRVMVFAPALDGRVRAFAATDGAELWRFRTARPFDTVNGVEAHGGSIDVSGVQAAGRMVYVQSGYSLFGELPGNVLLAFELPATTGGSD